MFTESMPWIMNMHCIWDDVFEGANCSINELVFEVQAALRGSCQARFENPGDSSVSRIRLRGSASEQINDFWVNPLSCPSCEDLPSVRHVETQPLLWHFFHRAPYVDR